MDLIHISINNEWILHCFYILCYLINIYIYIYKNKKGIDFEEKSFHTILII